MPRLPAVPLPAPIGGEIAAGRPSRRPTLQGPTPSRQAERLAPAFQRLSDALNEERLRIAGDDDAADPELIVVMEIGGDLQDFIAAIRRVPGLEFLADEAEDKLEPDDDFAVVDTKGRMRPYDRQLFVVASDHQAWQQILSLWNRFKAGQAFDRGLTPFRNLFTRLRTLRAWDDRDRLTRSGAASTWLEQLGELGDELVPFEAELWYRADESRRDAAVVEIRQGLEAQGGAVDKELVLSQISYHGLLGTAPASRLVDAAERQEVDWIRTEGIRLFHAIGQFAAPPMQQDDDAGENLSERDYDGSTPTRDPRIALLDGLPVENHVLLRDRLVVDDPDGWAAITPVENREHGTAMASLILHGDLGSTGSPISEHLYLRPIIRRQAPAWVRDPRELIPIDELPVELVHRAVVRMVGGDEPVAPGVKVVVLAVCDAAQMYSRFASPMARLLDWLADEYGLLFLVSAGNQLHPLTVPEDVDVGDRSELQHEVLTALLRTRGERRVLSPAESINAVTVGAAHSDSSDQTPPDGRVEPVDSVDALSAISSTGSGHMRSVKPDLLAPGGRQLARAEPPSNGVVPLTFQPSRRAPGLQTASPSLAGDLERTAFACGTSGATALAARGAANLMAELDDLRNSWGDGPAASDFDAVLIKALLAHTAGWRTARAPIEDVLNELGIRAKRDALSALLGYGRADPFDALECDNHRITAIRAASIASGRTHTYLLPLPPSLNRSTVKRRLTLTLSWLSPINPRHSRYRRARLRLYPPAGEDEVFGKRHEADWATTRRGTLQHEVLEGARAVPYGQNSAVELKIECKNDAGDLFTPVPYALAATVEVPAELNLPIYEEIRTALQVPVAVQASS